MLERRGAGLLFALGLLVATSGHAAYESPIAIDQRRGAEQTLLTYPEWFLVHSPAEYARFVADHPAHGFPFLAHVGQLWGSYAAVTREQVRQDAPANVAYHVMILVIASSTTVEYALRSAYENVAGRLSWAVSSGRTTSTSSARNPGTCSTSRRGCAGYGPTCPRSAPIRSASGSDDMRSRPNTRSRPRTES